MISSSPPQSADSSSVVGGTSTPDMLQSCLRSQTSYTEKISAVSERARRALASLESVYADAMARNASPLETLAQEQDFVGSIPLMEEVLKKLNPKAAAVAGGAATATTKISQLRAKLQELELHAFMFDEATPKKLAQNVVCLLLHCCSTVPPPAPRAQQADRVIEMLFETFCKPEQEYQKQQQQQEKKRARDENDAANLSTDDEEESSEICAQTPVTAGAGLANAPGAPRPRAAPGTARRRRLQMEN